MSSTTMATESDNSATAIPSSGMAYMFASVQVPTRSNDDVVGTHNTRIVVWEALGSERSEMNGVNVKHVT